MRLIDADALKKKAVLVNTDEECYSYILLEDVMDAPTIEERKTGRWIKVDGNFLCSVCDSGYKRQPTCMGKPMFMFCPCCGVKMEGVEQ